MSLKLKTNKHFFFLVSDANIKSSFNITFCIPVVYFIYLSYIAVTRCCILSKVLFWLSG